MIERQRVRLHETEQGDAHHAGERGRMRHSRIDPARRILAGVQRRMVDGIGAAAVHCPLQGWNAGEVQKRRPVAAGADIADRGAARPPFPFLRHRAPGLRITHSLRGAKYEVAQRR